MEDWIRIWMIIMEFTALIYLLIMLLISYGWYSSSVFIPSSIKKFVKVTVIIAVRNEALNIIDLLNSLRRQSYPFNYFDVLIVDDDSNDRTIETINQFKSKFQDINIEIIKSQRKGKKAALKQAIDMVDSEIIITTDGDCTVGNEWIQNYVSYYETSNVKLVFGPVFYNETKTLFQKIIFLEFTSLIASGAGSAGAGLSLMSNGANLSFRTSDYKHIHKEIQGNEYASGDDVFLLHTFSKHFGNNSVEFIKNENSRVYTRPPSDLKTFISQRVRWGSKAKAYKNIWPVIVTMSVFAFSLIMTITLLLSLLKIWFVALYSLFVILKFLIDYPLTNNFVRFYKQPVKTILLLPMEFIYPFYLIGTALASIFVPYSWKGRNVSK